MHRWSESPAASYLAGLATVYAALSFIAWLAGELAGCLWTRHWPPADGSDALAVLLYLSRDPGHPSLAWPAAARHDLAPAPLFYALAVVLLLAVVVPSGRLALAYLARGRRWLDPNPRRAGFATSTARASLSTAPAVGARLTLSYDLWLGLERGPMGGPCELLDDDLEADQVDGSVAEPAGSKLSGSTLIRFGGLHRGLDEPRSKPT